MECWLPFTGFLGLVAAAARNRHKTKDFCLEKNLWIDSYSDMHKYTDTNCKCLLFVRCIQTNSKNLLIHKTQSNYIYIYIYLHIYAHTYMCIHTHTHTHTYIYIYYV